MEIVQPIPTRAKLARAWLEHAHSFDRCVAGALIKLPRHVYSPNSEASVSNDGKITGFCKFLFLSSVIKFDNEMSEVKTKITIAQLLFMQSQNLLSKTRTTLFITR